MFLFEIGNNNINAVFRFAVDLPESLLDIFAALRDGSVLDASMFVFDTTPRPSNLETLCYLYI